MKARATLLLAYAALIAYASLYPFSWERAGVDALGFLHGAWTTYAPNADNLANLLAYVPLGVLLAVCLSGIGSLAGRIIVATLAGAALSFSLEFLQQFVPTRVPSQADLATNACGAMVGALLAGFLDPARFPGNVAARWRAHWVKPGREYVLGLIVIGAWALSQWLPAVPSFSVSNLRAGLAPAWHTLHDLSRFNFLEWGRYGFYISGLALLVRTLGNPGRPAMRMFFLFVAGVLAYKIAVIGRQVSLEAILGALAAIVLSGLWLAMRLRTVARVAMLFVVAGLLCGHILPGPKAPQHLSHWAPFLGPIDDLFLGLGSVLEILWPPAALGYLGRLAVAPSSQSRVAWIGGALMAIAIMVLGTLTPGTPYIPLITILLMAGTWTLFGALFLDSRQSETIMARRQSASRRAPGLTLVLALGFTMVLMPQRETFGATLRVGPGLPLKLPSAAAKVAREGDVIEIEAGLYAGDAAIWRRNRLIIRGVGGRAHLRADGAQAEGKAIWVVKGANTTVENIEFSGAQVADRNGAGIRLEGAGLTVRNCYFHDNENGILAAANPASDVVVEHSEFARNGAGDGQSHNLYIGTVRTFTLRNSYVHHARVGHNVKSRALKNIIENNRIMDEVDGRASYAIDLPNGGVSFVVGNLLQQGPQARNRRMLAYGAERYRNRPSRLFVFNNTFVNDQSAAARFIFVRDGADSVVAMNNVFSGPGHLPAELVDTGGNVRVARSAFLHPDRFDFRLRKKTAANPAGATSAASAYTRAAE